MGTTGIQIKMLQARLLIKDFWCMFPVPFSALPDKWVFSTAHLTECIIQWWTTHHPICASPQSRRAGIAPSYRAQLTVQHHIIHLIPKLLAHMPGLPADSEACTHVPIKTRVIWSSTAHYNFVSYVCFSLCLISVSDPGSAWGQWSVLIKQWSSSPEKPMWGSRWFFFNWATKTSWILQPSYSQVSSSFISEIQIVTSPLGDHSFFTCHLIQWCLEPNHVSCCNWKINNIYILLFQDVDFCYLWQILYSAVALIYQCFKVNKTLEMEWLCA